MHPIGKYICSLHHGHVSHPTKSPDEVHIKDLFAHLGAVPRRGAGKGRELDWAQHVHDRHVPVERRVFDHTLPGILTDRVERLPGEHVILGTGGDVHLLQGDARVRVHLGRTGLIDLALRDAHRLLENDEGSLHVLLQARHGCAIVHRVLGASGRHYRVGVAVVRAA
jgi:hypothetical protein